MTHNPNSQDEMAAEEYALDQRDLVVKCEGGSIDGIRATNTYFESKDAFLAGCAHKAEKLRMAEELIDEIYILMSGAPLIAPMTDAMILHKIDQFRKENG